LVDLPRITLECVAYRILKVLFQVLPAMKSIKHQAHMTTNARRSKDRKWPVTLLVLISTSFEIFSSRSLANEKRQHFSRAPTTRFMEKQNIHSVGKRSLAVAAPDKVPFPAVSTEMRVRVPQYCAQYCGAISDFVELDRAQLSVS
jgi:hypothetical protein